MLTGHCQGGERSSELSWINYIVCFFTGKEAGNTQGVNPLHKLVRIGRCVTQDVSLRNDQLIFLVKK
jgi:hypothetical protein